MKKDPIDKLFEDKLKDYGEIPENRVWKSIEASLDKKKKSRKPIPIWWKLGGAAAVLALVFYLLSPLGFNPEAEVPVSDTKEILTPSDRNEEQAIPAVTNSENNVQRNGKGEVNGGQSNARDDVSRGNAGFERAVDRENSLSDDQKEDAVRKPQAKPNMPISTSDKSAVAVAASESPAVPDATAIENSNADKLREKEHATENQPSLAMNVPQEEENKPAIQKEQAGRAVEENQDEIAEEATAPPGKSIFDEIIKSAEEEQQALVAGSASHWTVGPRVAPVYFNSFGQGSPIHSSFVANSKSGNVNLSYGLSLAYSISPKLSIRSGVHKVEYGYDTNDISFSPAFALSSGQQIDNIDYSLTARNLVVRNSSEAKAAQDALAVEVAAEFPERNGRMVQQFGYVEVPLELNLALVDSRLGLHLIGGFSSLFLVDNSVTLESQGNSTEMGEANNLNPVNFSTNLGFGLQYELTQKIQLNLEPVFKYQLNTFSDLEGNFNPYSIGVYSGLSFKF